MKLSLKIEYACRVLAQLARRHGSGELAHIEELAEAEAIPANYLVQILNDLRNGGLIISRRGKQGGYALAREPQDISVQDIIRVTDGDLLEQNSNTDGESGRVVSEIWREIASSLRDKTGEYTLVSFLSRDPEQMYYI